MNAQNGHYLLYIKAKSNKTTARYQMKRFSFALSYGIIQEYCTIKENIYV